MKFTLLSVLLCALLTSCTAAPKPERLSDDIELPPQTAETVETTTAAEITETSAVPQDTTIVTAASAPVDLPEGEYVYLYLQEDAGWECTAEIPHISISPELDAMVNADIDRLFTARIPDARNGAFGAYRVQYEYAVTDGIFSLLVWSREGTSPGSPVYPYTVTVDLETKEILTVHTVLAKYGYDYITIMQEIDQLSTSGGYIDDTMNDPDYYDMELFDFSGGMFFVNGDGHINLIGNVYHTSIGEATFDTYRWKNMYDLQEKTMHYLMWKELPDENQ